jgi:uncharacterized protein DUF2752
VRLARVLIPFGEGGLLAAPRRFALTVAAAGLPAVVFVYLRDPETVTLPLFRCLWLVATGTWCPGCGLTRAMHDLMHGRWLEALDHNAFGIVLVLLASALFARPLLKALWQNVWEPPRWPRHAAIVLLGTSLAWGVARNLPWQPFQLLAP